MSGIPAVPCPRMVTFSRLSCKESLETMRNSPVHWSEGMFLRPHHFQASDRYWSEAVALADQWNQHYGYGIRKIEISEQALANFQAQVTRIDARFPDGTLLTVEGGAAPDRIDLKGAFAKQSSVTLYLAIPKLVMGRPNVSAETGQSDARYAARVLPIQDESRGGNEQEVGTRTLNARLLLSTDDRAGYEVLPLARIKRAGEGESTPQLDDEYFPPMLAIDAWSPLCHDQVRVIYDMLGEKIDVLCQRVAERGLTLTSHDPGDLDDLFMLRILNEGYSTLRVLTFAQGVHPLTAYVELCRLVGMLSIFGPSRRVSDDMPQYDHDDLARIFLWLRRQVESLIGSRKQLNYEQRDFVGTELGMEVTIKPEWLHAGWDWYVGVNAENITDSECRELLLPGKLDWKMGSSQQVDMIFKYGVPGIDRKELTQAPRALPARRGWNYYEVIREGNAWKDVLATQSLALRFRAELIANLDSLPGQRTLEVMWGQKRAILKFALFAVPKQQT